MERKRDGFIPLGDVVAGVELPNSRTLTPATPQARHHFTTLRQVNQLIEASGAEPDLGFMARLLALCSLPRTNPKQRLQYVRRKWPICALHDGQQRKQAALRHAAASAPGVGLHRGGADAAPRARPRPALYEFMHKLGLDDQGGGERGNRVRLRNQMMRLFSCSVSVVYDEAGHKVQAQSFIADRAEYWWDVSRPDVPILWDSTIRIGEEFFNEIIAHPVPLDLHTFKSLKRSSLGLDLYLWLNYRTFTLKTPLTLTWRQLFRQFGADPLKVSKHGSVSMFRAHRGQRNPSGHRLAARYCWQASSVANWR